jgi:adenylate kinase
VVANPPKTEGICDACGGELAIRKDDAPETVKQRLTVYHNETEPLKEFYQKMGVLTEVEGNQPIENATKDILAALGV